MLLLRLNHGSYPGSSSLIQLGVDPIANSEAVRGRFPLAGADARALKEVGGARAAAGAIPVVVSHLGAGAPPTATGPALGAGHSRGRTSSFAAWADEFFNYWVFMKETSNRTNHEILTRN